MGVVEDLRGFAASLRLENPSTDYAATSSRYIKLYKVVLAVLHRRE